MKKTLGNTLTLAVAAATLMTVSVGSASAADKGDKGVELPATMIWSSYDVGSAGYAEASAMADAFGRKYGTRIRIQPSGSAIGRLEPILRKRAQIGFLATETFFATEGTQDFAKRRWGPQDLRVIAGRPSSHGVFTARDANIKSMKDLKGHRFAYTAGNPSMNVKCDAYLAFGGLTRDDVEAVMFPTYNAAMSSLAQGKTDATCSSTTASQIYELAESPRGVRWLEEPSDDKEAWTRMKKVAPFFQPYEETVGAGISEDHPVNILAWRYPVLVVTADTSEDVVYNFIKALDETYPMYKDATAVMKRWKLDRSGTPPIDAPFHPGAIKYLKEKGIWTDEMQKWNDERLARLNVLKAAWKDAVAEGEGKSNEEFANIWDKHRQESLDSL